METYAPYNSDVSTSFGEVNVAQPRTTSNSKTRKPGPLLLARENVFIGNNRGCYCGDHGVDRKGTGHHVGVEEVEDLGVPGQWCRKPRYRVH